MKKSLLLTLIGLLCFTLSFSQQTQNVSPGCVDGVIYLKYKTEALAGKKIKDPNNVGLNILPGIQSMVGTYGITKVYKPFYQADDDADLQRIFKVEFNNAAMVDNIVRDFTSNSSVEYAEKVPMTVTSFTTNDPSGPTLSGNQYFLNTINAQGAWNVFNGTSTIVVAVVDNAMQHTHTDFVGNIWTNPGEIAGNAIDDDANGYVDDVTGYDVGDNDNVVLPLNTTWNHGTHCCGLVGARTNNGIGISAIGFNVKIMCVKAEANASGPNTISNGYGGIIYAARTKARVISCSWGGTVSAVSDQSVINYAWNKGCVVICAAANDANSVLHYPAAYNNVYAVASSDAANIKSGFSCFGTWVDITTPGSNIYSTVPNNTYVNMSGTSMATPITAGLAGLILSANPYLNPTQVLNCISTTASNLYTIAANSPYAPNQLGAGLTNAFGAMNCATLTAGSKPSVDFYSNIQTTCPLNNIKFFDQSTLYPTAWSWAFQSGTPATSTVQNPTVNWALPGTYSVSLTATNINGSNSITKIAYITITNPGALPLVEGFQGAAWPPLNWVNDNKFTDSTKWSRATNAGGYGLSTASAIFDNYYNDAAGVRDGLQVPKLNFVGVTNARLRFDIAFARYDAQYSDTLEVQLSTNCGNTWSSIYMKGGTALSTAPDMTTAIFVPTGAQWRTDTINIQALVAGQSNVLISFVNHGHYGNALYLDNVNIAYTVAAAPAANYNTAASICSGAATTFTDTSTNSPTSWNWNMPGAAVTTSTLQNPSATYNTGGVYSVTLTATNGGGSNSIVKSITVTATPTVTTGGSTSICSGSSATLTAVGATSYVWNPGALPGASVVVSPGVTTTYTVAGTTGACAGNAMKTITVNPTPTVAVNSSSICLGGFALLTASGATTYTWNTGPTSNTISVSPVVTTVYTVTGTTAGCTNAKTSTVTIVANPTVAVNSSTVCAGTPANLTASGAITYSWNTGAATAAISVTPAVTTVYTVTGTSGTCNNVKTSTVTVNALPGVTLTTASNTMCTSATGGTTLSLTGSPVGGVYSGVGVAGNVFNAQAAAGNYNAIYSYTNAGNGCSNSVVQTISVSVCTGVVQLGTTLTGNIYVVPNPNNGQFAITHDAIENFDITIYNSIGQLVQFIPQNKTTVNVDLSNFGKGLYNILLSINGNYKTIKIIVE